MGLRVARDCDIPNLKKIESAFFTFVVSLSYLKILILKLTKELTYLLTYLLSEPTFEILRI